MHAKLDRFIAAALQMPCDAVHLDRDRESASLRMRAAIGRIDGHIRGAKLWIGRDLKLVVLPEYVLTGPPWGEPILEWSAKAALAIDGPEYAALAAIAAKHSVFLAGNAYELDPHFPGLYFQCSFVFDDSGRRILGYRRLISMFAPTPHDVWDRYLDIYGLEAVFPVADTVIGRLAAIASEEILYPEIARCHAIRGAEIFLHSSSETAALTLTPKQIARRARAAENLAYVVSANTAALDGLDIPRDSANGFSDIIDYLGNQIIQAGVGESMVANAPLELAGLRAWRQRPGMGNLLSRQALDLFAELYSKADLRRPNGLLKGGVVVVPDRSYFHHTQVETLARMKERRAMKAAIHATYGQPRDVLRVVEVSAEEPGASEIVVRMEAAAMHIADLRTIQGVAPFRFPLPRTPGFEGIGRVVRVGSEVRSFRVGDRVFSARGSGTFREEVRCRADDCVPAPEGDPVQLSLAMVNGATAAVLLEDCVPLEPGEWLIQNAANSNCGRYLITLAQLKGVRTVNVVRRLDVAEELRALGADVVLEDGPDLAARVAAAVAGAPIRLGIDAVAGPATQRIAECLTFGATVASYGSMTNCRCEIDFYLLFMQDLKLMGVAFTRQLATRRTPAEIRALYLRIAELTARGVLNAKIAGIYSLDRIIDACERAALTGADRDGKVMIRFDEGGAV